MVDDYAGVLELLSLSIGLPRASKLPTKAQEYPLQPAPGRVSSSVPRCLQSHPLGFYLSPESVVWG